MVASFIPFRGLIREVSGANAQDRKVNAAIQAGLTRRGFLKGVGSAKGCRYPASPAPASVVQARMDELKAMEQEKDAKKKAKSEAKADAKSDRDLAFKTEPDARSQSPRTDGRVMLRALCTVSDTRVDVVGLRRGAIRASDQRSAFVSTCRQLERRVYRGATAQHARFPCRRSRADCLLVRNRRSGGAQARRAVYRSFSRDAPAMQRRQLLRDDPQRSGARLRHSR
ncbi:hypothetical protein [Novosphingobium resinovorum]|uniref:hypothetical protein n=1 Tax=Novosphingobium resinovorum TaxID=158500 RepID=UPI003D298382